MPIKEQEQSMSARPRPDWIDYALILAEAARTRSENPWMTVGAVILRSDHSVAALGYNGPPPGVDVDYADRDATRPKMIHAEANALRYILPGQGDLIAVTLMPCADCLKLIAAYGIKKIVYSATYEASDIEYTQETAREFGLILIFRPLDVMITVGEVNQSRS
jgi:dCMP deaminase